MAATKVVEVHPLPIPLLVYIVNEWGDAPRFEAHEGTKPYPTAESLRVESPVFWEHFPPFDEQTLVDTANLIHPVFASTTGSECAQQLNTLIVESGMAPALSSDQWTVHEVWNSDRPERALLAGATLALIDHLRHEPDASRLGTCVGDACVDVYVDQSPAGRRQYCSLTCQNRARTRAYRAGKKASPEPAP
ncbi:CGNR zinc finger domain-containing protein [Microbacterium sp.]|uniref:CGNR zinc finger domain-containing protein n=1 Tax=Microbacterium sp. TaxID=51671 RepID=UPI003C74859E